MQTRSEDRENSFGHVLQCDIDENLSAVISLRKHDTWFYIAVDPEDIESEHLRGQYERRASACRKQQIAYLDLCNGSSEDQAGKKSDNEDKQESDSGYSSEEQVALALENDSEDKFKEWIQKPLQSMFNEHKPKASKVDHGSLKSWYESDIHCFSITSSSTETELKLAPRHDLDGEAHLRDSITPNMSMPKYMTERKDIDWFSPADIEVLAESHDIHMPLHPTIVRVKTGPGAYDHNTCFLKLAAKGMEPAVKRELKLLADFKKADLYKKGIRAPKLEGLVSLPSSPSSHTHILGFLLSLIPQPCRPLSKLMTTEISETKRKAWAKEVDRQVAILHDNDFLWGDVKADNFLVDLNDELWIIDFGGSYTVGWMDPGKYLTEEGEREAVDKIVDGVRDPDHCAEGLVADTDEKAPSQTEEAKQAKKEEKNEKEKRAKAGSETNGEKRKRSEEVDDAEKEESHNTKGKIRRKNE